jgi:hypothetical protein
MDEALKENGSEGFSGSLNSQRCRPATLTDSGIRSPWSFFSLAYRSMEFPCFSGTVASALQSATTHLGRARGKSKIEADVKAAWSNDPVVLTDGKGTPEMQGKTGQIN